MKLRVKEPIRNERSEIVGSGNYGLFGAGECFELPDEEAKRELAICGHSIEPYAAWQQRQRLEQVKQVYTRQQADDFARHQAELRQMSLAESDLRKQAASKRLNLPDLEASDLNKSFAPDLEKEELRLQNEKQQRTIAELKAQVEAIEKGANKHSKKKEMSKSDFLPDEAH